jgi:hypothetical protein
MHKHDVLHDIRHAIRGLFPALALLTLAAGCPASSGAALQETIQIPLGDPRAVCQGTERIEGTGAATAISRTITADGRCAVAIDWSGPLLPPERLSGKTKVVKVQLTFNKVHVTDAVGTSLTKIPLAGLSVDVTHEGKTLVSLSGKTDPVTLGTPKSVTLPAAATKALSKHLEQGKALTVKVQARLVVDDAFKKALAAQAQGPVLELRFSAQVE